MHDGRACGRSVRLHRKQGFMKNALLFIAALLTVVPTAHADGLDPESQVVLLVGLGAGGQRELTTTTTILGTEVTVDVEDDLEPAFTLGARYERPLADYLGLGLHLEWMRYGSENDDHPDGFLDVGLDPYVGLSFGRSLRIEPRLLVPIGYSMHILNEEDRVDEADGGFGAIANGFHVGVLGGVAIRHRSGIGGLLELGFMHHDAFDSNEDDNVHVRMRTNQFVLRAGFSIAL